MCHCGNSGVERTLIESQHTVITGEENSPAASARIRTLNFSIMSPVLYQQATPAPLQYTYSGSP